MAARPLIGVTGNSRRLSPSWWCTRVAVWLAGGQAHRISVRHHPHEELHDIDALIIGGGDDIHPELYGDEALATEEYDRARDNLESRYLKHAWGQNIPILGICRGAQLLNATRGGNLFRDIRGIRKKTTNRRRITPCKKARIFKNSILKQIIGTSDLPINSLHNQAINQPGDDLSICALDDDDIVQAICSTTSRQIALGVQWHPEYLFYRKPHFALFKWLVAQASK